MLREVGDIHFPIWLVGDSNPDRWESILGTPLDPRHPVRHNIWTAMLDVIQEKVYCDSRLRLASSSVYIRNAVDKASKKPKPGQVQWDIPVLNEISEINELISKNKPAMVLCFGAFAFEFLRRAMCEEIGRKYNYWGAKELGIEFRDRINSFGVSNTNILPLLHRSISGGKYIESHEYFCGEKGANYFDVVGNAIADKLLRHRDSLHIWIE